jgi:pyruvate,orthophosphate dikinase
MYGEVVDGVDGQRFEGAIADLKARRGVANDLELGADDLRELIATFQHIYEEEVGSAFPQDPREQLRRAYRAVFDSWDAPRAQVYRRTYEIPDDIGTAVNVVQMVFGNKGESSGTGVCSRATPRRASPCCTASSSSMLRVRTSSRACERRSRSRRCSGLPEAYAQLVETLDRLEAHYRDMQDIEFTVEEASSSCSRRARASARPRGAADRGRDGRRGLISREEAVARIDPASSTSCSTR